MKPIKSTHEKSKEEEGKMQELNVPRTPRFRERSPIQKGDNMSDPEVSQKLTETKIQGGRCKELQIKLRRINSAESVANTSSRGSRGTEKEKDKEDLQSQKARSITSQAMETGDETDDTETGDADLAIISGIKKRGRGRPPTTGVYYKRCERRAKEKELEELQKEAEILNPAIKPRDTNSYRQFVGRIEEMQGELEQAPTHDLEALIAEKTAAIYKVAVDSGNMKGTLTKMAKEAAADICAAATILATKAQNPTAIPQDKQLETIRKQLRLVIVENIHLKKALATHQRKGKKKPIKANSDMEGEDLGHSFTTSESRPITSDDEEEYQTRTRAGKEKIRNREAETTLPLVSGEASASRRIKEGRADISKRTTQPPVDGEAHISQTTGYDIEMVPSSMDGDTTVTTGEREEELMEVDKTTVTQKATSTPIGNEELKLIAKIEGIFERLLEERGLGKRTPIYAEQRRTAALNKVITASKTAPAATTSAAAGKQQKKGKEKPRIVNVTTLNPPAKSARSAVRTDSSYEPQKTKTGGAVNTNKSKPKGAKKEGEKRTGPPTTEHQPAHDSWATVGSRKTQRKAAAERKGVEPKKQGQNATNMNKKGIKGPGTRPTPPKGRKEPRMAAVTLTCPPGKYEEVTREARQKIDIEGLGIQGLKIKRAITGAVMYEVPGENSHALADALAAQLRKTVGGREGVKVERPTKTAELMIRGLDDATSPLEIRRAIGAASACAEEEITVGDVRRAPNGTGTAWVRCPLAAANKVASLAHLTVGWAMTRVELLANRPLQCFKCLEGGHVRQRCPNTVDRSGRCYRCGEIGHAAKTCEGRLNCPVCSDKGLPSNHRVGGKACAPVQKGKRGLPMNKTIGDLSHKQVGRTAVPTTSPKEGEEQPPRPTTQGDEEQDPPPKEQRVPRTSERRKPEEEQPPKGGNKRRRTRAVIEDDESSGMDTEVENKEEGKDTTKNHG